MSDPNWWKKAVFYQIYPRSFQDTSGNGVGDLKGITRRLEYVADLGVDGVWISPFLQSPMKDFGYDISDYNQIDPIFGTMTDFEALLERAHSLNLKIIMDMVLSHTSDQHEWFVESRKDKTNSKADWYVWADANKDGNPPNNWVSVFGGSAWEWDENRQQYYLHNFIKEQPDLNFYNEEVQQVVLSACRFWLDKGVDGLRLDVINFIFHDQELRDNPMKNDDDQTFATQFDGDDPYNRQHHVYDKSRPEALEFIERLRALADEYPDKMTLAEVGDDNATACAAAYVANDRKLHTAYSFALMTGDQITASTVRDAVVDFQNEPGKGWPSWAMSNHDVIRPVTRWGSAIKDKEAFAILLLKTLLSLRGTPFIYQGEELGLPEFENIAFEDIQDPWGKHLWPQWQGRDGCRIPMPWQNDQVNAGFSKSEKTWLPIPDNHIVRAVNTQKSDQNSVLSKVKEFISFRKTNSVLQNGDIEFIDSGDEKVLVFDRFDKSSRLRCFFNLSEQQKTFEGIDLAPFEGLFIPQ